MVNENNRPARNAPKAKDPRCLSEDEILQLRDGGYDVREFYDTDPPLYGWLRTDCDASQLNYKTQQPLRRSMQQAWVDCRDYAGGEFPSPPTPDWLT